MEPAQEEQKTIIKKPVNNRAVLMAAVLFLLIICGMFIFAFLKNSELQQEQTSVSDTTEVDDRFSYLTRIDGKHYYIDGVHTIVGEIAMPTPCDLLETDTIVAESFPEQVTINFSVINNAEICTQVITPARFKVSVPVSSEATFNARFEGRQIDLNLIEAEPGERPEDFELFLKG